ncbi:hypothetical protein ACQJBY_033927 [Aegilops geniculata]
MPRGMKVKEKTVRGSARPVGGLEKAKTTKKKKTDDSLQLQPKMPFANEMPTNNPILMCQFGENIVPGSGRPVGGSEKAKTKKKKKAVHSLQQRPEMPLTNQMPGYLPQYKPTQMVHLGAPPNHVYPYVAHYNPSLQQSIGLSTPTMMPGQNLLLFQQQTPTSGTCTPMMMTGHNIPFFQQQNPTIGTSSPTMMPEQNLSFFQQQTPTSGTCTPMMMPGQNLSFFQQQNPTSGTSTPTMMPGQNLPFSQQQKPA